MPNATEGFNIKNVIQTKNDSNNSLIAQSEVRSDRPEYAPKLDNLSEEKRGEKVENKNISTIQSNLKSSQNTKSNRLVVILDKNQKKHSERFMEGSNEGYMIMGSDCLSPEMGMRPKKKYLVVK